jgi:hypothetical protein
MKAHTYYGYDYRNLFVGSANPMSMRHNQSLGFKIFEVATRDDVGYVLAKATTCSY